MKYKFGYISDKEEHEAESSSLWRIRCKLLVTFRLFYMTDYGFDIFDKNQTPPDHMSCNSSKCIKILDLDHNINSYKSNVKYEIRKSLKFNHIREVSKSEFINSCKEIYNEFNSSKGISKLQGNLPYEDFVRNIQGNGFFLCFDITTNRPVSFCIVLAKSQSVQLSTIKYYSYNAKNNYCNYALIYHILDFYKYSHKYISNGYRSDDGHSGIQDFLKKKFAFIEIPVNRYIVLNPLLFIFSKMKFLNKFPFSRYFK